MQHFVMANRFGKANYTAMQEMARVYFAEDAIRKVVWNDAGVSCVFVQSKDRSLYYEYNHKEGKNLSLNLESIFLTITGGGYYKSRTIHRYLYLTKKKILVIFKDSQDNYRFSYTVSILTESQFRKIKP